MRFLFALFCVIGISPALLFATVSCSGEVLPESSGGPATWNEDTYAIIGEYDYGRLDIDGDYVDCGACYVAADGTSIGFLSVTGSDSVFDVRSDSIYSFASIGFYGYGNLDMFLQARAYINNQLVIGEKTGSEGYVSLRTGSHLEVQNSLFSDQGNIYIGVFGNGSLELFEDSSVDADYGCVAGFEYGSYGNLSVNTSTFTSQYLNVGYGGEGDASVSEGGIIDVLDATELGTISGSYGRLLVEDVGTEYYTGPLIAGIAGEANVEVREQATLVCTDDYCGIIIGQNSGSSGLVKVSDSGTILVAPRINVGVEGQGRLFIYSGMVQVDSIGGTGSINMARGGQLAVYGNYSSSIQAFAGSMFGAVTINYLDEVNPAWRNILGADAGEYDLKYYNSGDMVGYTVLTVGGVTPIFIGGDADTDGDVDIFDFLILKSNFGTQSGAQWKNGDFDGDSDVDIFDFLILKANYGR